MKKTLFLFAICLTSLSSCALTRLSSSSSESAIIDELEGQEVSKYGFQYLNNTQYADSLPTKGRYSVLALPIEFYRFTERKLTDLDKTLNADNDSLFHAGDCFDIDTYRNYFPDKGRFNNGEEFPYLIDVLSVSEKSAVIQIKEA